MKPTFSTSFIKPVITSIFAISFTLGVSGCAYNSIFINYPSQIAPIKQELNSATPMADINKLASNIQGNDGLLYAQEAGRVAQVAGDFANSKNIISKPSVPIPPSMIKPKLVPVT